jgi:hypothetical protein
MRIAFFETQKGVMKAAYSLTAVVAGLMLAQATLGLAFRTQYRDVEWIAVGLCDLGDRRRSSVLYLLVLAVNSIIAVARGMTEGAGEIPLWAVLAAMTWAATLLLFAHAEPRPSHSQTHESTNLFLEV